MAKILYFITQSEFGGAQRYVFDLASNLKADFEIAVALGEQGKNGTLAKKLAKQGIKVYALPNLKRSINPLNDFLALLQIIKLIKNYQPDIIHLNSSKISILGSMAALCAGRSMLCVVYTVHGWVFNEPLPYWLKLFYKYAEKFTARFKNKIICVSEYDWQTALKYKIAPENKLVTIHNGINLRHPGLDPGSRVQLNEIISGLRVKPAMTSGFLAGSIGNLYKTKGYKYLIEAADILINKQKISATFIIIGEGAERTKLEKLIKKYNLKNHFILAGQIDNAAKLLKAFNLYACSSVKEGLSYTLIEAMQAGLPIVATNVGGNPELIEDGVTGLLSESQNPVNLADKIKKLMGDKKLAVELGNQARQKALAEFGLTEMVEKTKKIYSVMLKRTPALSRGER